MLDPANLTNCILVVHQSFSRSKPTEIFLNYPIQPGRDNHTAKYIYGFQEVLLLDITVPDYKIGLSLLQAVPTRS